MTYLYTLQLASLYLSLANETVSGDAAKLFAMKGIIKNSRDEKDQLVIWWQQIYSKDKPWWEGKTIRPLGFPKTVRLEMEVESSTRNIWHEMGQVAFEKKSLLQYWCQ